MTRSRSAGRSRSRPRAAALLLVLLAGCGYRTGFTVPEQRAVGVAIFDNVSRERDLERDLHAALTDSLQRLVDAPLVSPSAADLRIDGRITEYIRRSGIRNKDNVRLETGVRITVVANLVRPGSPQTDAASETETEPVAEPVEILRQVVVSDERGYLLADPVGEARARELVLRHVADRVVIELFGDLAFPPGDDAPSAGAATSRAPATGGSAPSEGTAPPG